MKTATKKSLFIALLLCGGGILLALVPLLTVRFDFRKLNTASTVNEDTAVNEPFSYIQIAGEGCSVRLLPAEDGVCRVTYSGNEALSPTVTVRQGTLHIEQKEHRSWIDCIGFSWGEDTVTVFLPDEKYNSLSVENTSGNVTVDAIPLFRLTDIHVESGNVNVANCAVEWLSAQTTSGNIRIKDLTAETLECHTDSGKINSEGWYAEGTCRIKSKSGNVSLDEGSTGDLAVDTTSGNIKLEEVIAIGAFTVTGKSGEVELDACDGDTVTVQTASGNVSGKLLTEKTFVTSTDSGTVRVPATAGDGVCRITTRSGDIRFE